MFRTWPWGLVSVGKGSQDLRMRAASRSRKERNVDEGVSKGSKREPNAKPKHLESIFK